MPPFGAVQCVEGPRHTRGTPPNVVEIDAETWLRLADRRPQPWAEALAGGRLRVSGTRAHLDGLLPLPDASPTRPRGGGLVTRHADPAVEGPTHEGLRRRSGGRVRRTGFATASRSFPRCPWREAAPLWAAAEELGFAHAWTYDHLVWGGLPDSPWFAAVPTLAAAAGVTSTIGLGTFVSSPNYRHPYTFARDVLTLDDLTGGRFLCGLGTGGDLDARILGEDRTLKERVDRFHEFVPLLDRLLREDRVDHEGACYTDARRPHPPGSGPAPGAAARRGERATLRPAGRHRSATAGSPTADRATRSTTWFDHVGELVGRFDDALADGRPRPADRYLSLDSSPRFSLESVELYAEMAGRAAELGFTDVVTHWPRPDGPYAGDVAVLEAVAADVRHPPRSLTPRLRLSDCRTRGRRRRSGAI